LTCYRFRGKMGVMRTRINLLPALLLCALSSSPAFCARAHKAVSATAPTAGRWEKEIRAFELRDRTSPPPKGAIEFAGSSSIRKWKNAASLFPGHKVFTRGFGGSEMSDLVAYAPRIVIAYRPKLVLVYEGDNDIAAGKSPDRVLSDYKAFVTEVHAALPETRIAYIAVKPCPDRARYLGQIRRLNRLVRQYSRTSDRLLFADVFSPMLSRDGRPRADLYLKDGLHPNARGYAIWVKAFTPILDRYDRPSRHRTSQEEKR
jgi:GDSL-like Lipase/Acylhydrolase family